MTAEGKVRAQRYDKFRQVNRFLELVEDVLPALPAEGPLRVVDFGSGKSYLTFALHHLLTVVHRREVEIVGLDLKADVVDRLRGARPHARRRRPPVRGGRHRRVRTRSRASTSSSACTPATPPPTTRSTAPFGPARPVILAVPCCQHELLPQLARPALDPLLRHGTLRERFAAEVTDAARAQLLGAVGYDVQVVEFVELEHTPKNVLLRAIARPGRDTAKAYGEYRAFAARARDRPGARPAPRRPPARMTSTAGQVTCAPPRSPAVEQLAGTATRSLRAGCSSRRAVHGGGTLSSTAVSRPTSGLRSPHSPARCCSFAGPSGVVGVTVIRARSEESGGSATRQEIGSLADLPATDLEPATTSRGRSSSSAPTDAATRAAPGSARRSSRR